MRRNPGRAAAAPGATALGNTGPERPARGLRGASARAGAEAGLRAPHACASGEGAEKAQTAPERLATKRGRALATCQRGVWGHAKAGFKAREDRVSPSANQMTQERGETGEKEEGTPNRAVMDGGTSLWLRHKGQLVPIPQAYRFVRKMRAFPSDSTKQAVS